MTPSITFARTHLSPSLYGAKMVGSVKNTTLEVGSNGIAATIWVAASPLKISAKLNAGERLGGMLPR